MSSESGLYHKQESFALESITSCGTNDEELDADDLEVAFINESFEQQLKHSMLFADTNLKQIFYGAPDPTTEAPKKQSPDLGIDTNDYKMEEVTPPPLCVLPPLTPHSPSENEDDLERGRQLDLELEKMMLEADQEKCPEQDSPAFVTSAKHKTTSYYSITAFSSQPMLLDYLNNIHSSFESQLDDHSSECADAAEQLAFDVVSSLFTDDEHNGTTDPFSDDEESLMINSSIMQVLQEDEVFSDGTCEMEDDDPKLKVNKTSAYTKEEISEIEHPPPPSRNSSMQTISSPMSDEQTVPVLDSWEELGDSPVAAEKVYSEAKAVLKKIRAERRATQL